MRETTITPKWLKGLREKAGLTQSDLAAELGCSKAAVCQWESGKKRPDAKKTRVLREMAARYEYRDESHGRILVREWSFETPQTKAVRRLILHGDYEDARAIIDTLINLGSLAMPGADPYVFPVLHARRAQCQRALHDADKLTAATATLEGYEDGLDLIHNHSEVPVDRLGVLRMLLDGQAGAMFELATVTDSSPKERRALGIKILKILDKSYEMRADPENGITITRNALRVCSALLNDESRFTRYWNRLRRLYDAEDMFEKQAREMLKQDKGDWRNAMNYAIVKKLLSQRSSALSLLPVVVALVCALALTPLNPAREGDNTAVADATPTCQVDSCVSSDTAAARDVGIEPYLLARAGWDYTS